MSTDLLALMASADDGFTEYVFGTPRTFYGQIYTSFTVSTNGWISFGGATNSALGETIPGFLTNTAGAPAVANQPMVAALWEDLDLGNNASQALFVDEDSTTGILRVTWQNADYWPTDFAGTFYVEFDANNGTMVMDYTGLMPTIAPMEGIVGVSDGDIAQAVLAQPAGPDTEADLVVGGAVAMATLGMDYASYFQDFSGLGTVAAETIDLAGQSLTFFDTSNFGNWIVL